MIIIIIIGDLGFPGILTLNSLPIYSSVPPGHDLWNCVNKYVL